MGLKQGLEQVVVAARAAVLSAPQVRFILLGEGSQRAALESASKDLPSVQFLPTQSADDYAQALMAADVLLLSERGTSVDMSLPSKLTAYCAAGRPIVAAVREGGATWTEVERIGAGLLVPAGDPTALLAALARLAGDPKMAAELGARGLDHAQGRYSEEDAFARVDDLVSRLLTSGRRAEAVA
jgi:glycosyltransferase involved in cell wall biosynthesis